MSGRFLTINCSSALEPASQGRSQEKANPLQNYRLITVRKKQMMTWRFGRGVRRSS